MELKEIVEAVKGTDAAAFKEALHKEAHGHYQAIFNDGHKSGKGQAMEKADALQGQLDTLTAELEAKGKELSGKDDEIAKIAASKPDLEQLKSDYEQKLIDKDTAHKMALEQADAKHKELEAKVLAKEKGRIRQSLVNELIALHADSWAANKAVDASVMDRIHINGDDTHKIYQPDGSTPYMPAEGQSSLSLLAREVLETIPKELVRPPKNNGSNYQKNGNGSSPTKTGLKRSEMSRADKLAFIKEHGSEKLLEVPE